MDIGYYANLFDISLSDEEITFTEKVDPYEALDQIVIISFLTTKVEKGQKV